VSIPNWLDPDELRVFRSFARATRALYIQFDRELQRDVGLPRTYFEILWLLNQAPGKALRMSDLAEATGSLPSRMTHAVTRLEKEGQVRRELCTDDRRGWYAVLTEAGERMLDVAAPSYAASVRRHFIEPLSEEERQQLTAIGEHLLAHLETSTLDGGIDTTDAGGDEPDHKGALTP
jgi:DNA-binding MarR family transcriptional regulator